MTRRELLQAAENGRSVYRTGHDYCCRVEPGVEEFEGGVFVWVHADEDEWLVDAASAANLDTLATRYEAVG